MYHPGLVRKFWPPEVRAKVLSIDPKEVEKCIANKEMIREIADYAKDKKTGLYDVKEARAIWAFRVIQKTIVIDPVKVEALVKQGVLSKNDIKAVWRE